MLQGMAIGVIWVPLTIATFATARTRPTSPRRWRVFHLLRNIGSSFFISICVAEIVRATRRQLQPHDRDDHALQQTLSLPWVMGGWDTETLPGWPGCRRRSTGRRR